MPKARNSISSIQSWRALAMLAATIAALSSCAGEARSHDEPDGGADTDVDTDTSSDTDTDTDTDADAGTDECGDTVLAGSATVTAAADLAALEGVTRITGDLDIQNTVLPNVNGLESLVCVDGNVTISDNDSLAPASALDGLCNLRRIGGTLTVVYNEGAGGQAITRIGLAALTRVEGGVLFQSNLLASLDGLENLEYVGGTGLRLESNSQLTSVDGLDGLTTIDGDLRINGELANVDGLSNLTELNGSFRLDQVGDLDLSGLAGLTEVQNIDIVAGSGNLQKSLYGLHNIHTVHGNLNLYWLDSLEDLQGLSGLTTVEGVPGWDTTFNITMCNSLKDLSGLENFTSAPGVIFLINGNNSLLSVHGVENLELIRLLDVFSNSVLDNLDGFTGLRHITGPIYYISGNSALRSIRGLHHLEDVGSSVTVVDNPMLPTCRAQAFIDYLQSVGWDESYDLTNNGPDAGCDEEPL